MRLFTGTHISILSKVWEQSGDIVGWLGDARNDGHVEILMVMEIQVG
jgi:hypothetical protein